MWQSFKKAGSGVKVTSILGVLCIVGIILVRANGAISPLQPLSTPSPLPITVPSPSPTPTSSLKSFTRHITIVGTAQQGVLFTAPISGQYEIIIVDGAYSTYSGPHWKSEIRIYKNKSLQWGILPGHTDKEPVNFDVSIGDRLERDRTTALAIAKNRGAILDLQSGDKLLFVPADAQNLYSDNSGQIDLEIVLL